ncbi:hypothetical protein AVO45_06910 [Ruegeria marisrubri]|uniref:Bacteriophage phiJL001 Gp84 C-terminal domain-containing protein n=1 Tax=Ruegeria marisrubri TaxID=1685379 RepID=A0A0X3TYS5_9RHOB|nr:DUF2163 domain-containing protein [Ruegeria marisrubri]KUJ80754.1 hypothetical protein AVO45_06910 [Ruegeria marisrubri]
MAGMSEAFRAHVETGLTTICRCWAITRADGVTYGFTDHDLDMAFEGVTFRANTGLTAMALEQSTGLSIDNSEAMGVLSDAAVTEEDIEAGRFDGAEVRAWLVNWAKPDERWLQFRGSIGELRRSGGAFHAEIRGLTDALNQPQGRIYQKPCTAVLGDGNCRFDLSRPGYSAEIDLLWSEDGRAFYFEGLQGFEPGWFQRGRLTVEGGKAQGLWGVIKDDFFEGDYRVVELWQAIPGGIAGGDRIKLEAGCDKRTETCRLKFNNFLNFQGFPDLPSEDWAMAVPKKSGANKGGSRR